MSINHADETLMERPLDERSLTVAQEACTVCRNGSFRLFASQLGFQRVFHLVESQLGALLLGGLA